MARMTALDFVTFLRKRMGNPTTEEWTDDYLLRMVNLAQMRIAASLARSQRLRELETYGNITTASQSTETKYELPAAALYITAVQNVTDGIPMKPINRWEYAKKAIGTIPTGSPVQYFESGRGSNSIKSLVFFPEADGVYTVRCWYIAEPTELVLSPTATSSALPEEFDEVILDIATEIGKTWNEDVQGGMAERQRAGDTAGMVASGNRPEAANVERHPGAPVAPGTRLRRGGA